MNLYFDKAGTPIDRHEWSRLMEIPAYRVVAKSEVRGVLVSTVWLGLNHGSEARPLLFESMDFPAQERCERYATEAEALQGHAQMVADVEASFRAIGGALANE